MIEKFKRLFVNSDDKIREKDRLAIGTDEYTGIVWFGWNGEYKHVLREATPKQRRDVHNLFLAHGLALNGTSETHEKIIRRCVKPFAVF